MESMQEQEKENPGRAERIKQDVCDYVGLRMDNLRLGLIEHLSTLLSTVCSVAIAFILAGLGILFLAAALTWMLGILIGSILSAVFIMSVLFFVLGVVFYANRKKLVVNPAVRMLSKVIFDIDKKYSDHE